MTASVSNPDSSLPPDIAAIHAFSQISAILLDLDDLLATAVDILSGAYDFDLLAILLLDDQTGQIELKAHHSPQPLNVLETLSPILDQAIKSQQIERLENRPTRLDQPANLSYLAIPFPIGKLVIGTLIAASADPALLSTHTEQMLTIFAGQLTVAIINARNNARTQRQKREELVRRQIATHLQELTTIINATLDFDDVLNLILKHIAVVIPYDQAVVSLLDGQNLVIKAVSGVDPEHIGHQIDATREIFYQQILVQQYPSILHDISQNTFWRLSHPLFLDSTRAWIGAPLVIKKRIIGLLTLHSPEKGSFDNADPELVNTFANQAAIAIDNAQIYQREQQKVKQFKTVAKIGRRVTEIREIDQLLETVIGGLHYDLGYEFISIFLYQGPTDTLILKAASDFSREEVEALNRQVLLQGPGVISTAARTEETILINDVSAFEGYFPGPGREAVLSELAIPLVTHENFVGVLDIQSNRKHSFSPEDLSLAQTVADQLAVAVETATLFKEHDQRIAELLTFNQIGTAMTDPTNPANTLASILEKIKGLFQVEGASLMLLEEGKLRFEVAVGIPKENLQAFALSIDEGFAGWVAQNKCPLRIDDARTDARHYKQVDQAIHFNTRTVLAVPVQIGERVLGVIEVINRLDHHKFSANDEFILTFIASTIAIILENSRLLTTVTRKVEQMEGLFEASQSLTKLNLAEVLENTVKQVARLLQSQAAIIYLVDETQAQAVPGPVYHRQGLVIEPCSMALDEGTMGWVIKYKIPLRINGLQADERFGQASSRQIKNLLSVPLIAGDNVIGVLETFNKENAQPFTAEDEALITTLTRQAAAAIVNAKLFDTVSHREKFAMALGRVGQSINTNLNLDKILDIVCQEGLSLFDIHTICIWRAQNDALHSLRGMGENVAALTSEPLLLSQDHGLITEVFKTGRPAFQNTLAVANLHLPEWTQPPIVSGLFVPLLKSGQAVGVLGMFHTQNQHYFSPEVQDRAVIYSNQITTAIENAYMHQETERRLVEVSTLYTLAHRIAANLDIQHTLEDIVAVIRLTLDAVGCNVFIVEGDRLAPGARSGLLSMAGHAFVLKIIQQLFTTPNPVNYLSQADFPPDTEPYPKDVNSVLMVPMLTHGKLVGALAVYDRRISAFGPNEGRLLTIIATQAASALENSKLFDDLQQHAKNLENALAELQKLHELQGEFVQNVSHELRTPLTFIKGYVDLILEGDLGVVPDTVKKSLEIVAQRTLDLNRLVTDIVIHRQLAMNVLHCRETNLTDVISLATTSAIPTANQKNITLLVDITPDLPLIIADPDRIGQVFDNLIGNALKFTESGDTITVSARLEPGQIRINVEDTGIGMSESELDKIFSRFYQIDSTAHRSGGSGLGLNIVKQIVEAHHGQIHVTSQLGMGSKFSFTLPLTPP